jgi:hypothetical protein
MATQQMLLSSSVSAARSRIGTQPTTVADFLNVLFAIHPEYGSRLAKPHLVSAEDHERRTPDEWLDSAQQLFATPGGTMHGRLLVMALSMLELRIGQLLSASGVLAAVVAELTDAPPLRSEFLGHWTTLLGETPYPPPEPPSAASSAPSVGQAAGPAARKVPAQKVVGDPALPPEEQEAPEPAAAPAGGAGERSERVRAQRDDPAMVDQLGRRPFAEVIAARMDEVWKAQRHERDSLDGLCVGAFMVHIHGPWGVGKTSLLNFLRTALQDEERPAEDRWVTVGFNAWRHQRIRPPWWALIREIYTQSARQLGFFGSLWLRLRWFWWRLRADWLPVLLALVLIVVAVLFGIGAIDLVPAPSGPGGGAGLSSELGAKAVELILKVVTAVFAAGAVVIAFGRSLVFGSARAAQTYMELRSDPLRPIALLFEKLVAAVGRPIAVLVDDLDRCEGKYVIELLEGIQTLFRGAPVTYVVAADRKWICSSFQKEYEEFGKTIGEPGRPLGYLFLDKVFQVSASVPMLSPQAQSGYWQALLHSTGSSDPGKLEETRKQAEREAAVSMRNVHTQEGLEAKIGDAGLDVVQQQAMRAAAAKQITSAEARAEATHRLQPFSHLLEPNPRSMKRFVNTFGLHQATHLLEGRSVAPDALARWTLLELRWPLLADYLAAHPRGADQIAERRAPGDPNLPEELTRLFSDEEVHEVVAGDGTPDASPLDEAAVRAIMGLVVPAIPPTPASAPR